MDSRDSLHFSFVFRPTAPVAEIDLLAEYEAVLDFVRLTLVSVHPHFEGLIAPMKRDETPGFEDTPITAPGLAQMLIDQQELFETTDASPEELGNIIYLARTEPLSAQGKDITALTVFWGGTAAPDRMKVSLRLPFLDPVPDLTMVETLVRRVHRWRPLRHFVCGGQSVLFGQRVFPDKHSVGWASWFPAVVGGDALAEAYFAKAMLDGTLVASASEPFDYTRENEVRAMQDLDLLLNMANHLPSIIEVPLEP